MQPLCVVISKQGFAVAAYDNQLASAPFSAGGGGAFFETAEMQLRRNDGVMGFALNGLRVDAIPASRVEIKVGLRVRVQLGRVGQNISAANAIVRHVSNADGAFYLDFALPCRVKSGIVVDLAGKCIGVVANDAGEKCLSLAALRQMFKVK